MSPRAIGAADPPAHARAPLTPALTETTIELLQQTAPRPTPMADPPVEPFLRGVDEPPADDVLVCWRSGLRLEEDDEEGCMYRQALLTLAPPAPEELVPLGLRRFHALLVVRFSERGRRAAAAKAARDEADVEGGDAPEAIRADIVPGGSRPLARFVVVRDGEIAEAGAAGDLRPRDVRPGDVVVFDSETGGYADGALAPASDAAVEDVGNPAAIAAGGDRRLALRLSRETLMGSSDEHDSLLRLAGRLADEAVVPTGEQAERLLRGLGASAADLAGSPLEVRRVGGAQSLPDVDMWDELGGEDVEADDGALLDAERPPHQAAFVLVLAAQQRPDLVRPRERRHRGSRITLGQSLSVPRCSRATSTNPPPMRWCTRLGLTTMARPTIGSRPSTAVGR